MTINAMPRIGEPMQTFSADERRILIVDGGGTHVLDLDMTQKPSGISWQVQCAIRDAHEIGYHRAMEDVRRLIGAK
jgi:hypothetical protein